MSTIMSNRIFPRIAILKLSCGGGGDFNTFNRVATPIHIFSAWNFENVFSYENVRIQGVQHPEFEFQCNDCHPSIGHLHKLPIYHHKITFYFKCTLYKFLDKIHKNSIKQKTIKINQAPIINYIPSLRIWRPSW